MNLGSHKMNLTTTKFYVDVRDRSILALEGPDGLDLLQRISTNNVAKLKIGEHTGTVLSTEKGRIIDVIIVFRVAANSLILAGASKESGELSKWIERFIVMEDARLSSLFDKRIQVLALNLNRNDITADLAKNNIYSAELEYPGPRQTLFVTNKENHHDLVMFLEGNGVTRLSADEYESYRIRNAILGFPNELSAQFNPLEVGLRSFVSFTKGCYVGQEVIARLDTYQKVQKSVRRLRLSEVPEHLPSDLLTQDREKVGILTSCVRPSRPDEPIFGLGLISSKEEKMKLIYPQFKNDLNGRAEVIFQ
jgi:tRNA-modifying protein YgfZ